MTEEIRGLDQIRDDSIGRSKLNVTLAGESTIRKVIAGSGISLQSTGVDGGTGDVTIISSATASISGAVAGGDLRGTYPDPTVYGASNSFRLSNKIIYSWPTGSGTLHNFNISGLINASIVEFDSGPTYGYLTGIAGGDLGRILVIYQGFENNIILAHNSGSTPSNRFWLAGGDVILTYGEAAILQYMGTYWHIIGKESHANLRGGWEPVNSLFFDWTRTGDFTFTVSLDKTDIFYKGVKVRWKDGGAYKYGTVLSATYAAGTTTVTLFTNADYTMSDTTITDTAVSYSDNPKGYPDWFNYTVTWGGFSTDPSNVVSKFRIKGRAVEGYIRCATAGTSNATTMTATIPCTAATVTNAIWVKPLLWTDASVNGTTPGIGRVLSAGTGIECYKDFVTGAWTNTGSKSVRYLEFEYPF